MAIRFEWSPEGGKAREEKIKERKAQREGFLERELRNENVFIYEGSHILYPLPQWPCHQDVASLMATRLVDYDLFWSV